MRRPPTLAAMTLAAMTLALALSGPAAAQDAPDVAPMMTLEQYSVELGALLSSLDAGDLEAVRARAAGLQGRSIALEAGSISADAWVLRPLAEAATIDAARARRGALAGLVRSLGPSPSPPGPPDAELLRRLRDEQAAPAPEEGTLDLPRARLTIPERVNAWIASALEAVRHALGRLLHWLVRLLGGSAGAGGGLGARTVIIGLVALLLGLLVGVALLAWRSRGRPAPARTAPVDSQQQAQLDADPLSRDVREWIDRAEELAAAGRFRESLRAWYHAVLASLFASRLVHPRRGRTNWEHVFTLPAQLPSRPAIVRLTQDFDREWYGLNSTTREALDDFAARALRLVRSTGRDEPRDGRAA